VPAVARLRAALFLAALPALLAGCAQWHTHGLVPGADRRYAVAILPVEDAAGVARLARIRDDVPPGLTPAGEAARVREAMAAVTTDLTDRLRREAAGADPLRAAPPEAVDRALAGAPAESPGRAMAVGRATGVPAVLVVRLTGYGAIERRWLVYLIGSGVVEGVVQGVVAARVVDNPWIGAAVFAEEVAQEVLTWGGGAWLFNAWYAPVTLEARLVASDDGATLWRDTVFVPRDRKALKALPEAERERRSVQLRVTARRAARELIDDLARSARYRANPPRPGVSRWGGGR
jgi:hypothetical protein